MKIIITDNRPITKQIVSGLIYALLIYYLLLSFILIINNLKECIVMVICFLIGIGLSELYEWSKNDN